MHGIERFLQDFNKYFELLRLNSGFDSLWAGHEAVFFITKRAVFFIAKTKIKLLIYGQIIDKSIEKC